MRERPGQAFIGFKCAPEFRDAMIAASSGAPLSEFVRAAVIEELKRIGIRVPRELAAPPSRLGKGGPKRKTGAVKRPRNREAGSAAVVPFVTIEQDGATPMPQAACAQAAAFMASAMLNEQPEGAPPPAAASAQKKRATKYQNKREPRAEKKPKP